MIGQGLLMLLPLIRYYSLRSFTQIRLMERKNTLTILRQVHKKIKLPQHETAAL